MIYRKEYKYIPKYEYASTNQHGERFKLVNHERISICKLIASDESENQQLILLGTTLDIPVRFDFNSHRAYIELVSAEFIKTIL